MMTFFISTSLNRVFCQISNPPLEDQCVVLGDSPSYLPLENINCPFSSILPGDLTSLPQTTININIHYVKYTGNQVPAGNFSPLVSWGDPFNGNKVAELLIGGCNADAQNIVANQLNLAKGYPNYVGDSKFRLRIQGDPGNPNDIYNGIWYWDAYPTTFPNNNVFNIVISDNGPGNNSVNGDTYFGSKGMNLYNLYRLTYLNQAHWWDYKRLIWHELGHAYGKLCHSFETQGGCSNVDVDTPGECGLGNGNNNCGSPDMPNCKNFNTPSNNIMGYNGKVPWGISPCQWFKFYQGIYKTAHESSIDFCSDNTQGPVIIPSGVSITWDNLKLLNRDIIIQTGAQLTIQCEVRMGEERTIRVKRGAKLIVDGGIVRNLCFEKRWGGIYVEGNSGISQPDPGSFPNTTQAGIVYIKNNSRIERAADAIVTARYGELWNEAYWGGVIFAESSSFINNRRVAAFMKYNFSNKSRFQHCTMNETGAFSNSVGVTVWNCKGITFKHNNFGPFDKQAIYGIDMGINVVDNNQIHHCKRGIEGLVTTPVIGNDINIIGEPFANVFINNAEYDIYQNGGDLAGTFWVKKNNFVAGSVSNYASVITEGYAKMTINDNQFEKRDNGIWLSNSLQPAFLYCNTFANIPNAIRLVGNNEQTLFYNNVFNTAGNNIAVLEGGTPGKVFSPQTSSPNLPSNLLAADNCFNSNNLNDIYAKSIETVQFRYKSTEPNNSCYIPNNNLSDGGTNNYLLEPADNSEQSCTGPFLIPPTQQVYESWRSNTGILKAQYDVTPSNSTADAFHFADLKLMQWRALLVDQALDSMNYSVANTVLASETSLIASKMKFGLALAQHNYTDAQYILNQLPLNNAEDQYFKYTQQVCLEMNQLPWSDTLTSTQISNLNTIALSNKPSKVYARGILALKTGASFDPEIVGITGDLENLEAGKLERVDLENNWTLSPNPADHTLKIQLNFNVSGTKLQILDVFGQEMIKSELKPGLTELNLNISKLHSGLYIVQLKKMGESIQIQKFIKN